jgi:APA family basic amino acid/polyamine antiporter
MADPLPAPSGLLDEETEFRRGLGLFDATMVVVGAMIGSGIFVVSADMSRLIGSPGWLLVAWLVTGVMTVSAALSYGELAAMMPHAGGQYVFLREAFSPLWGFLYGWTLVLVIQAGTIAAVGVAFARFAGVLFPEISETNYVVEPWHFSDGYALSLSKAQLVAIAMIAILTAANMCGINWGRVIQNIFTVTKTGALFALIVFGLTLCWNSSAVERNFGDFWSRHPTKAVAPATAAEPEATAVPELTAAPELLAPPGLTSVTAFGLFVALCAAQVGSLFSADSWNNVTIIAGEIKEPRRNVPLALGLGTGIVITLYLLANVAYLVSLPFEAIQNAPSDLVGTAVLKTRFPDTGAAVMAVALMISTFGCNNGLILAGARASYAMARDGLFFPQAARLNAARVPGWGLTLQGLWAAFLVLPRTRLDGKYGNLYSDLLDYVISAALLFYILTILGIFRLRHTRPDAPRPYRAFGYPVVPAFYIVGAATVLVVLFVYRWPTTGPGLAIVFLGLPMYFLLKRKQRRASS